MGKFVVAALVLAFTAATAAPSLAGSAERFPVSDTVFQSTNDCTGNFTTWRQSNQFMVEHRDGPQDFTLTITGDVSTADGYFGRFTAAIHFNLERLESYPYLVGQSGVATTYTLHGPGGALLLTHEVIHLVAMPDGSRHGWVSDVERRCLGNPGH